MAAFEADAEPPVTTIETSRYSSDTTSGGGSETSDIDVTPIPSSDALTRISAYGSFDADRAYRQFSSFVSGPVSPPVFSFSGTNGLNRRDETPVPPPSYRHVMPEVTPDLVSSPAGARHYGNAVNEGQNGAANTIAEAARNSSARPFPVPPNTWQLAGQNLKDFAKALRDDIVELSSKLVGDDPVDPVSGEFLYHHVDLALPGVGIDFRFERFYRSGWRYLGSLGHGWTHSYDQRLTLQDGGTIQWQSGDGKIWGFAPIEGDSWRSATDPGVVLRALGADFELKRSDGIVLRFVPWSDAVWVLAQICGFRKL